MMAVACGALASAAWPARAQVGYTPEASPFRDVTFRQQLSAYTGWFVSPHDAAGVAPQSGPLLGARYDVSVGGPASFTLRLTRVFSQRDVIDPTKPVATRNLGTQSWPLYIADAGLSINLTGRKSWHQLIPVLTGGAGIASDLGKPTDVGGFRFGTTFAFSFGAGVRWVPGGHFQLRADLGDYLYQIQYPESYFTKTSDSTQVLGTGQSQGIWQHHAALTIGASYLFYR